MFERTKSEQLKVPDGRQKERDKDKARANFCIYIITNSLHILHTEIDTRMRFIYIHLHTRSGLSDYNLRKQNKRHFDTSVFCEYVKFNLKLVILLLTLIIIQTHVMHMRAY